MVASLALVGLLAWVASAQSAADALPKLDAIAVEATTVIEANFHLPKRQKLPQWVIDAQWRILELAEEAKQIIILSGPAKPPAGGGSSGPACTVNVANVDDDVRDALTNAANNAVICIAAGSASWDEEVGLTLTATNVTLRGAGDFNTTGGGDATIIVDDYASNNRLLAIGAATGSTVRIAGLTLQGGSGSRKDNGLLAVAGVAIIDHVTLSTQTYTNSDARGASRVLRVHGTGVLAQSIINVSVNSAIYITNGLVDEATRGNQSWADPTDFGTDDTYFYIEDNIYSGYLADTFPSRILDCFNQGSRVVVRFNTIKYSSGPETHATGSSAEMRGCRSVETYGNRFMELDGQAEPANDMHDASGGTHMILFNTADANTLASGIIGHNTRDDNGTYAQNSTPSRLGYCGQAFWAATVDTTNAANSVVTADSFSGGAAGWTGTGATGAYAVAAGGQIVINSVTYTVQSVDSATQITLTGNAGAQSNVASYILSNWDGNTDQYGYPCMDQTGRGEGDLLSGDLPTLVNQTNGNADHTSANAWPRQALEPVYIAGNTITPDGGNFYGLTATIIVAGRDYYKQASGIQTSADNCTTACSPFDGTTTDVVAGGANSGGVGWGRKLQRPTTCTTGVAYIATDEGSWNTSSSNPYGVNLAGADWKMYICTATNTWTARYGSAVSAGTAGEPLTYPHPARVTP
jgi:hypothetical protein